MQRFMCRMKSEKKIRKVKNYQENNYFSSLRNEMARETWPAVSLGEYVLSREIVSVRRIWMKTQSQRTNNSANRVIVCFNENNERLDNDLSITK